MIITIDGPAGSGKSTVARILAERLRLPFLDTGAMYRAVAYAVLRDGIRESDSEAVARMVRKLTVSGLDGAVLLDGQDVTADIRTAEVTAVSSIVAANPTVRSRLVELQRISGDAGSLVTEGRDQGTVVFPSAEFKFFITADLEARARRRQRELAAGGSSLSLSVVREQLRQRDERDESRAHAPMKPADDARIIDTSDLTIAQVVQQLIEQINGKSPRRHPPRSHAVDDCA